MRRNYKPVNAVYGDDFKSLLSSLGIYKNFIENKLTCKFCKEIVTENNVYSIIKDSDRYKLVCSKAECVSALMEFLEAKRKKGGVNG